MYVDSLFAPLASRLLPHSHLFKGNVLNAGAGSSDLSHLVDGKLYSQDLVNHPSIDFVGPIHKIPVGDGFFDAVICNAVLEHVANPHEVVEEFARVLRPDGVLYLSVPFMQPVHPDPTDFQRYTEDGLRLLAETHGFDVVDSGPSHSVYTTVGWILGEWAGSLPTVLGKTIKLILFLALAPIARRSKRQVPSIASSHYIVATRQPSRRNGRRW